MSGYYFFIDIELAGNDIVAGSVVGANDGVWQCPENDCDIIGAFYNNVCVGWTYPYFNNGYTVPVMMNDGNFPQYLSSGSVPEFRLYDRSSGIIFNTMTNEGIPPCYHNSFEIVPSLYDQGEWSENVNYFIELFAGQNLVSFFALPVDVSVANVMQSIELNAVSIIGEGIVASNIGNGFWVGSLSDISRTDGYWIKVLEDDTLFVSGTRDSIPEISIYRGNNLISFPLDDTVAISQAIPNNIEDNFESIIGEAVVAQNLYFDNDEYDEMWFGSLSHLQSKKGYWVKYVDESIDHNTPVSFYFEGNSGFSRDDFYLENIKNDFDYIQSVEQAFYFIESINGVEVNNDDWILAYNGIQIVGARQWNGSNTDVPAMGFYDDSTVDYCKVWDKPKFYIYNEDCGSMTQLYGDVPGWSSNGIFNVSLSVQGLAVPQGFDLKPTYPNPFNTLTNIEYGLPTDTFVSIAIYDIAGREVEQLIHTQQLAGYHRLMWDAEKQSTGLYFVKLIAGEYRQTQKLILIK